MTKRTLIEKSIAINKFTFLASILILCLLITVSLVCGSIASNIPQSIEKQKTSSLQARLLFVAPSDLIWDENKINQISKLENRGLKMHPIDKVKIHIHTHRMTNFDLFSFIISPPKI